MSTYNEMRTQVCVLKAALERISRTRECEPGQVRPVYGSWDCVQFASLALDMLKEMEKENEEDNNN